MPRYNIKVTLEHIPAAPEPFEEDLSFDVIADTEEDAYAMIDQEIDKHSRYVDDYEIDDTSTVSESVTLVDSSEDAIIRCPKTADLFEKAA